MPARNLCQILLNNVAKDAAFKRREKAFANEMGHWIA